MTSVTSYFSFKYLIKPLIAIFCTVVLLISCSSRERLSTSVRTDDNELSKLQDIFFDPVRLGAYNNQTTPLVISAKFSECGEFGGHSEKLQIYATARSSFQARYLRYELDCAPPPPPELDGIPSPDRRKIEVDSIIELNDYSQRQINLYLVRLLGATIQCRHIGHAGNTFSVVDGDSTLLMRVYDSRSENVESYFELLDALDLPIPILEEESSVFARMKKQRSPSPVDSI